VAIQGTRRCRGLARQVESCIDDTGPPGQPTKRQAGLLRVREWFAPAFSPEETLLAALAVTPFRLTMVNSLVATGKALVGHNQGRVLLLTDRSIHIVSRKFWRRRFKRVMSSYPVGTVPVTLDTKRAHVTSLGLDSGAALCIGDQRFYLNVAGFQMDGIVGSRQDVDLFVAAGGR
jgi:hypothetical protein